MNDLLFYAFAAVGVLSGAATAIRLGLMVSRFGLIEGVKEFQRRIEAENRVWD